MFVFSLFLLNMKADYLFNGRSGFFLLYWFFLSIFCIFLLFRLDFSPLFIRIKDAILLGHLLIIGLPASLGYNYHYGSLIYCFWPMVELVDVNSGPLILMTLNIYAQSYCKDLYSMNINFDTVIVSIAIYTLLSMLLIHSFLYIFHLIKCCLMGL